MRLSKYHDIWPTCKQMLSIERADWPKLHLFFNTLRPRQNGRRFADDTFKRIFLNENVRISIKISLKFVPKGPINKNPALVQIMAWRRSGDKPLSEPMLVSLPTHICVTRPQWVKARDATAQWSPSGNAKFRLTLFFSVLFTNVVIRMKTQILD